MSIKNKDKNEKNKIIEDEIKKESLVENNKALNNETKEEKHIIDENKKDKIIKANLKNKTSKTFPVKSDIDFNLKKQYKSAQKFDDKEVISGTILPESNLIVIGNSNGQLYIYYYYSGEIEKYFSLFHEIKNINSIDKETIIYSSQYSINLIT